MNDKIVVKGAREHNLKNIDITLPKNSLVVISGLSGSGKSSLAFDTIFAEGQRRYMESLSSYARMFLGRLEKPDVDSIEGLSPAIAIEQKSTNRNPRSTVGTVTEIYDYYRLLWARIGHLYCPKCGREITEVSIDQIMDFIFSHPEDGKLMILSPLARGKKGEYRQILEDALKIGYMKAEIDGKIYNLDEGIPQIEKKLKHNVSIVVDRVKNNKKARTRISEAVEKACDMSGGLVEVFYVDEGVRELYNQKNSCPDCGITIPEIEPRFFSFNSLQLVLVLNVMVLDTLKSLMLIKSFPIEVSATMMEVSQHIAQRQRLTGLDWRLSIHTMASSFQLLFPIFPIGFWIS